MATGFSEDVWSLISKVPKGRVTTYKIIADRLGTRAYRAVGSACNKNPDAPRVPCHRVVGSDGSVEGYAHGKKAKISLLRSEGLTIKHEKIESFRRVLFRL